MQILKKAAGLAAAFGVLLSFMTAAPAGITASAHGDAVIVKGDQLILTYEEAQEAVIGSDTYIPYSIYIENGTPASSMGISFKYDSPEKPNGYFEFSESMYQIGPATDENCTSVFIRPQNKTDDALNEMAIQDYKLKTGITPADSDLTADEDGSVEITLFAEDGSKLDTYRVDAVTGIGTNAAGETVNLPQTGMTSPAAAAAAGAGAVLILCGAYAVMRSGMLRRSRDDEI